MSNEKLSNLPAKEAREVIESRIANTKWLREEAIKSRDTIVTGAADLDEIAKGMGVYIEYNEALDPYEDQY